MKLIVFDFDKTLTITDTLLPISKFICTKDKKRLRYLAVIINYLLFQLKYMDEIIFKNKLAYLLLKNKTEIILEEQLNDFYRIYSKKLFIPQMLKVVDTANKDNSHKCIISSNYNVFVKPVLNILKIDDIEATELEIKNGVFTGSIIGNICNNTEKGKRLSKIKEKNLYTETIAYGDSGGDIELFRNSDKSYLVKIIYQNNLQKFYNKLYYLLGLIPPEAYDIKINEFKDQ